MKRNCLTRAESRRLEDWLLAHWDRIAEEQLTQAEAAEIAEIDLGLKLTFSNIKGAADVFNKTWPTFAKRATQDPDAAVLAGKIHRLGRSVVLLADIVASLYRRMDEPLPAGLAAIIFTDDVGDDPDGG